MDETSLDHTRESNSSLDHPFLSNSADLFVKNIQLLGYNEQEVTNRQIFFELPTSHLSFLKLLFASPL